MRTTCSGSSWMKWKSAPKDEAQGSGSGLRQDLGPRSVSRELLPRALSPEALSRRRSPMPKRTDLKRILVIGSGPIVIGQALRVRLFRHPGVQGPARRGARGRPRQQQPGDDHDRPGARGSHLRRAADARSPRRDHRAREAGRAAADGRRPDGAQSGGRARRERHAREVRRRADWRLGRRDQDRRGSAALPRRDAAIGADVPESRYVRSIEEALAAVEELGFPVHHPPVVHARRRRRRHRLQHRGVPRARRPRARLQPGPRGAARGVGDRLEGVRARGHARPRRQLRRHLLDRERRSDGRAHRRQHHRRAGADADRQRVPADARSRAPDHPQGRRRDRRVEHPVRDQPRERPHHRHRDEPARVAIVGAGVEGDRVSRSRRSPPSSRSATTSTRSRTTSRGSRRPRSSRRSTTSSSRCRAGRSRSSRAPIAR